MWSMTVRLCCRHRQPAPRGVLQDLHGGAPGVRAAGVRPHRGVHGVRQAARRVPHLPPVRRARRALLPLLSTPALCLMITTNVCLR